MTTDVNPEKVAREFMEFQQWIHGHWNCDSYHSLKKVASNIGSLIELEGKTKLLASSFKESANGNMDFAIETGALSFLVALCHVARLEADIVALLLKEPSLAAYIKKP